MLGAFIGKICEQNIPICQTPEQITAKLSNKTLPNSRNALILKKFCCILLKTISLSFCDSGILL